MKQIAGRARIIAVLVAVFLHLGILFLFQGGGAAGNQAQAASSDFPLTAALSIRMPQAPVSTTAIDEIPEPDIPEPDIPDMEAAIEIQEEPDDQDQPELEEPANKPAEEPTDEHIAHDSVMDREGNGVELSEAGGSAGASAGSGPAGREFLPIFQVDTRPEIIQRAELVYPEAARRQNREGSVVVEIDLTENGSIESHRIIRSAGHGFDEAALAMLTRSRFAPAYVGQRAVAVRARFTINFRLQD